MPAEDQAVERAAKTLSPALADPATIRGWGVDADVRNDPTYPIRDQSRDHGLTRDWNRPPVQRPGVEILQSIEHVRQPAVVGTSVPPRGVSGAMRRAAFRWSESNWLHWLILLGADRVDMIEGVAEDLSRGRVPNVPAEMGARAAWQHDREGSIRRWGFAAATVAVVASIAVNVRRERATARTTRLPASAERESDRPSF
ncbi:hypothetical protein ACMGDM_18595 [Sphingomonas sp. DT-51]|uniref:hypothetical protein n=1 Tax=Sphingomonas sp. DT-51 TaxID=3396165 RepID=UPI003F1AF7B4